jgi:hypothetical protein
MREYGGIVIGPIAKVAAALNALLFLASISAAPDRYHGSRDGRHEPEIHRPGHIIHELPLGYRTMDIHGVRYFERGGVYFRPAEGGYIMVEPPEGGVIVTPGIGSVVATLPIGTVNVTVGGTLYYRHGGAFYRPARNGYVVVEPPPSLVVVESQPPPPASTPPQVISSPAPQYVSVWVGDHEYLFRDGVFYKNAPEGLRPVEAPVGVVLSTLPAGSLDMWIGENEYFYCKSTFYRKVPAGYQVVTSPPNAYIKALPKNARTIWTGGKKLFYLDGSYYEQRDEGFLITAPPVVLTPGTLPIGTIVAAPPEGSVEYWVNDTEYLYFAGNFYRKTPAGFVVVANPM